MKKLLCAALSLVLCLTLAVCACAEDAGSDLAYVQEKGSLAVGITNFAPMDYQDEAGEWIGCDADMARLFAESLGVDVEFIEINWDYKVEELNAKNIDVVWNGMTLLEDVMNAMGTSVPYCLNALVLVVPAETAADFASPARPTRRSSTC